MTNGKEIIANESEHEQRIDSGVPMSATGSANEECLEKGRED